MLWSLGENGNELDLESIDSVDARGRSPAEWENKVIAYLNEREGKRNRTGMCKDEMYGQEQIDTFP